MLEERGARIAVLEAANTALLFALYDMRFMWATHAEECNYVRTKYKGKCDCDWPTILKPADAAIIKATGAESLDAAIEIVRKRRRAAAAYPTHSEGGDCHGK